MNGARFVHDQLEVAGWQVEIADAQKVKGLAPLACKTDKIDAWVLAELSRRDLVPAIWLPTPGVRAEREHARWRLHLVKPPHRAEEPHPPTLLAFGHPCPVSDLFGVGGRELLEPAGAARAVGGRRRRRAASDRRARPSDHRLRTCAAADGRRPPLCPAVDDHPRVGWVLGYTIAAEIGDITRFPSPTKLAAHAARVGSWPAAVHCGINLMFTPTATPAAARDRGSHP